MLPRRQNIFSYTIKNSTQHYIICCVRIGTPILNVFVLQNQQPIQKLNAARRFWISGVCPRHLNFLAFSPISTRRRMASGRPGISVCFRRHWSRNAMSVNGIRTLTAAVSTGGRPRGFLALSIVDFMVLRCHKIASRASGETQARL